MVRLGGVRQGALRHDMVSQGRVGGRGLDGLVPPDWAIDPKHQAGNDRLIDFTYDGELGSCGLIRSLLAALKSDTKVSLGWFDGFAGA
jgi:hypothetical protein